MMRQANMLSCDSMSECGYVYVRTYVQYVSMYMYV